MASSAVHLPDAPSSDLLHPEQRSYTSTRYPMYTRWDNLNDAAFSFLNNPVKPTDFGIYLYFRWNGLPSQR